MNTSLAGAALLLVTAQLVSQPVEEWHFDDPDWLKETADRIARCVGTLRGGADMMRQGGQENSAVYLEDSARGYLLVSQMLLTQRADALGRVLYGDDSEQYVEALAYGEESHFKAMFETNDSEVSAMLDGCLEVNELVSVVIQAMRETTTGIE